MRKEVSVKAISKAGNISSKKIYQNMGKQREFIEVH